MFLAMVSLTYLIIVTVLVTRNNVARSSQDNKWANTIAYVVFTVSFICFEVSFKSYAACCK